MRAPGLPILLIILTLIASCAGAGRIDAISDVESGPTPADCAPFAPLPPLDLQADLAKAVRRNQGYGGGLFQVGHEVRGAWWQGVSGALSKNSDPMTLDATFEIASISKTFTAAVVLLLVEEGALDLDQPIGQILPSDVTQGLLVIDGHDYGPEITVRQLLNHTSGLPDYWNDPPFVEPEVNAFLKAYLDDPDRLWSPKEILAYVRDLTPIAKPGETWHYADTGYVLAGLIIEQLTAKPLHQVYRQRIFEPLRMQNTWLRWREPATGSAPRSHRYDGRWDMYAHRHNSADWAGGGLVSSVQDLEIFLHALAVGDLLDQRTSLNTMQQWIPTGMTDVEYGLGLFRIDLDGLGELWGHDGYGNSWMYYWPQQQVTFIGTLNQSENDWWPLVETAILEIDDLAADNPCLSLAPTFTPLIIRTTGA